MALSLHNDVPTHPVLQRTLLVLTSHYTLFSIIIIITTFVLHLLYTILHHTYHILYQTLERYRKHGDDGLLKCKRCVHETQETERAVAEAKQQQQHQQLAVAVAKTTTKGSKDDTTKEQQQRQQQDDDEETRICAGCQQTIAMAWFNKNQWNKGAGKSKCRPCVDSAVALETTKQEEPKQERLQAAKRNVTVAQSSNNVLAILKAESELAALEAEFVTGLKPVKMSGRGGGSYRSGSHGSGHGRGRVNGRQG